MKARKPIPRMSAKRAALHPELTYSTLSRSSQKTKTRKPVKRVNVKRQKSEKARANGSEAFSNWFYTQPCAVCGWIGTGWEFVQKCHAKTGGMARKADAEFTFPGCPPRVDYRAKTLAEMSIEGCHHELHRIGVKSFEKKHGVNLLDLAAKTWAAWLAVSERANWAQLGKRT